MPFTLCQIYLKKANHSWLGSNDWNFYNWIWKHSRIFFYLFWIAINKIRLFAVLYNSLTEISLNISEPFKYNICWIKKGQNGNKPNYFWNEYQIMVNQLSLIDPELLSGTILCFSFGRSPKMQNIFWNLLTFWMSKNILFNLNKYVPLKTQYWIFSLHVHIIISY